MAKRQKQETFPLTLYIWYDSESDLLLCTKEIKGFGDGEVVATYQRVEVNKVKVTTELVPDAKF